MMHNSPGPLQHERLFPLIPAHTHVHTPRHRAQRDRTHVQPVERVNPPKAERVDNDQVRLELCDETLGLVGEADVFGVRPRKEQVFEQEAGEECAEKGGSVAYASAGSLLVSKSRSPHSANGGLGQSSDPRKTNSPGRSPGYFFSQFSINCGAIPVPSSLWNVAFSGHREATLPMEQMCTSKRSPYCCKRVFETVMCTLA